jgi:hypothetical protein
MKKTFVVTMLLTVAAPLFGSQCKQPLDERTLNQLQLGWFGDVQLQPGQSKQFQLAILSSYAPDTKVAACVVWELKPAAQGATIDQNGLLKIDGKTPPGSKFTVIAHIENGRAERGATVLVYSPQTQPLVGLWKQTEQYDCGSGDRVYVGPIGVLEFRASGWFSVTWTPFETYRDYVGEYSFDPPKHALSLKITSGAFVPRIFHGQGTYRLLDDKTLELRGLYLGSHDEDKHQSATDGKPAMPACRYVFRLNSRPE